jgi:hypothetical protein
MYKSLAAVVTPVREHPMSKLKIDGAIRKHFKNFMRFLSEASAVLLQLKPASHQCDISFEEIMYR